MNIKDLKPISSDHEGLNTLYRNLKEFVAQLTGNPLLGGLYLKNVELTSAAKPINHGLGKPWTGYIVTRRNNLVNIMDTRSIYDDKTITLTADTTVIVDLWIF